MTTQPTPANALEMVPIAVVRGGRAEPIDDDWGDMLCEIVLDDRFPPDALDGLDEFSHVDVVYVFDIKPYMAEFAPRTPVRQPPWSHELMRDYWTIVPPVADPGGSVGGVVIERLGVDDVQRALAAFEMMHDVFDEDPGVLSDGYVTRLLADESFWAIAAFEAGEAIGCITGHELAMTRHERTELFVYDLAVRADRQRRGIGRRLVDALVTGAADRGIDVVFVPADDDDTHALAFYTSLGGRPAKVTMFDLGSE